MLKDMRSHVFLIAFALRVVARNVQLIGRDTSLSDSYDFVVVGGGTSGLTVADRLTENPKSQSHSSQPLLVNVILTFA